MKFVYICLYSKFNAMAISDLYASGAHKKEIGHFANIVKLALSDNIISENEQALIDRMASKLNITETEYNKILSNPAGIPITSPPGYEKRIERLYNLSKMVLVDSEATESQIGILNKISIGLGFSKENYKDVTAEAINQIMNDCSLEEFSEGIKKVN